MPHDQRGRPRMERYNLYMPPEMIQRLDALAVRTGLTISDHMRRAVETYLQLCEQQPLAPPGQPP